MNLYFVYRVKSMIQFYKLGKVSIDKSNKLSFILNCSKLGDENEGKAG